MRFDILVNKVERVHQSQTVQHPPFECINAKKTLDFCGFAFFHVELDGIFIANNVKVELGLCLRTDLQCRAYFVECIFYKNILDLEKIGSDLPTHHIRRITENLLVIFEKHPFCYISAVTIENFNNFREIPL
jgi:hypothetical protein